MLTQKKKTETVYGAMARAYALAAGVERWFEVTEWTREVDEPDEE